MKKVILALLVFSGIQVLAGASSGSAAVQDPEKFQRSIDSLAGTPIGGSLFMLVFSPLLQKAQGLLKNAAQYRKLGNNSLAEAYVSDAKYIVDVLATIPFNDRGIDREISKVKAFGSHNMVKLLAERGTLPGF